MGVLVDAPGVEAPPVQLTVPARPEFVGLVRLFVATLAASRRELAEERVDDLKLAVSEATTNAMESYRSAGRDAVVTVTWWDGPDRLVVSVADEGGGFDVDKVPKHPPVTTSERLRFERGLGIPIIRALVDECAFERMPKGMTVRLVMFCGPREDRA